MDSVSLQSSSGGDNSRAARPFSFNSTDFPPHLRPTPPLLNYIQLQNPTWPTPASTAARKKRSRPRASRRAPTTVLTTDPTNFRAMVEEFTGIPTHPFNSSSPRLHLFRPTSTLLEPPYHLRRSSALPTLPINCQLLPITQRSNLFQAQNLNPMFLFPNSNAIPIYDFGSTTTLHDLPNQIKTAVSGGGYSFASGGRGPENGGEGMVESWICSSD